MTRTNYVILVNDMCIEESIEGDYRARAIEIIQDYPIGSVTVTGVTPATEYYVSYMYRGELDLYRGSWNSCIAFIEDTIEDNALNPREEKVLQDYTPQEF